MSKKFGLIILAVLALSLNACERAASQAPQATVVDNNFPAPVGTTTGMGIIEQAGTQTAIALIDSLATPGIPADVVNGPTATATALGGLPPLPTITGQPGVIDTPLPTPTINPATINTPQPTLQTTKPTTYTLQQGEFAYCLARRFNVDPDELLTLNGIYDSETLQPGYVLKIPSGGAFPGPRALKAHPATYTVQANDTIYSIACLYGDIDPVNIANANGLAAPYNLTTGAQISIP